MSNDGGVLMYRIEYRCEVHPEFGYFHCYAVKCKARIVTRRGIRRVKWVEMGPCDSAGVLMR